MGYKQPGQQLALAPVFGAGVAGEIRFSFVSNLVSGCGGELLDRSDPCLLHCLPGSR